MKGNKIYFIFLVGSFVVASLLIYLYRAIETDIHIIAFLFLSLLIVMFFCAFLLELMFVEPVIDRIIDFAQESKLFYNVLLLSLLFTIVIILPTKIIPSRDTLLENGDKANPSNCSLIITSLLESPKSVYDTKLLSKCKYTQPLAKIIPTQGGDIDNIAWNLPLVVEEYMGLFSQNLAFALTILFATLGGVSYSVLVALIIKKGALLILWLLNSSARKMIIDGTSTPRRKAMTRYSKFSSGKQLTEPLIIIGTVRPKEQPAHDMLERGNKNYSQQKYDEAIHDYTEAILKTRWYNENWTQLDEIYDNRGAARYNSNDYDGAIKDFSEAIHLMPDFADYYYNRGVAYRATGNFALAIKDFDEAVRLNSDNADYYFNRGITRRTMGDPHGAINDFDKAINLKPDNAFAFNNRSHVRRIIGDLEGALADLREAIRIKPDYGLARMNMLGLLKKLGENSAIDEEENLVRELMQKENEYNQACFEAICENADKALELLKIGLEKGQWSKQWASQEPNFENILDDPRFKELVDE